MEKYSNMKNRINTMKRSISGILGSLFLGLVLLGASGVSANAQTNSVITRPGGRFY
jgi:hypothetical protein